MAATRGASHENAYSGAYLQRILLHELRLEANSVK